MLQNFSCVKIVLKNVCTSGVCNFHTAIGVPKNYINFQIYGTCIMCILCYVHVCTYMYVSHFCLHTVQYIRIFIEVHSY